MSRFGFLAASFTCAWLTLSGPAHASNYPPGFSDQVARAVHRGPVLFVHVGSGIIDKEVFGYKNSGYLTQFSPEAIDAVITVTCRSFGYSTVTESKTVRLGREWHRTGYLSKSIDRVELLPPGCDPQNVEPFQVAFTDGRGHWDSQYGRNYRYGWDDLWGVRSQAVVFATHDGGFEVNLKAWEFIVDQMRQ